MLLYAATNVPQTCMPVSHRWYNVSLTAYWQAKDGKEIAVLDDSLREEMNTWQHYV